MPKTTYLVIKCGNSLKVNAANEVDAVIKSKGFCWFAKFGLPIKVERLELENPDHNIILCIAMMFNRQYELFPYKVNAFSKDKTQKRGTYPSYYKDNLGKVGTWINVSKFLGATPTTNDLIIKSSLNKLTHTIIKAKVGYFFCKHIND